MGKYDNRPLKAFIKYDKRDIIVAGSLIIRRRIPKGVGWVEIPFTRCCEPDEGGGGGGGDIATTTSTTTKPTITTTSTTTYYCPGPKEVEKE